MTLIHNTPNMSRIETALKVEAQRLVQRKHDALRKMYKADRRRYLEMYWPKGAGTIPHTTPELIAKMGDMVAKWKLARERSPSAFIHPLVDNMHKIAAALKFEMEA